MSQIAQYQQYTIKSSPEPSMNDGRWRLKSLIWWKEADSPNSRAFTADTFNQTEREADVHGITYGQRIIDGKIPGVDRSMNLS